MDLGGSVCNVDFDDAGWMQGSLPISCDGLGVRASTSLVLSAFLSSVSSSEPMILEILKDGLITDHDAAISLILEWTAIQ